MSTAVDGRFRILGQLGAGAMGIVYHAEDILLERPAALKVIAPTLAATPAAEKSFFREARALARLRHENVVQVYSLGSASGQLYLAMEYVDGESLEARILRLSKRGEAFPLATALDIVTHVASGLSAAHARSVIHRDVKPSNIVIERDTGRPVLIDFGIAREIAASARSSFVVAGTPGYMAPEQLKNDRSAFSHKVDVYGLACTAFELLTGRLVFDDDGEDVILAHMSAVPPPISALRAECACMDAVLARALAKSPHHRHETCDAFAAELVNAARRAGVLPSSDTRAAPGPGSVRVLVLANEDGLRQVVVRQITKLLHTMGAATDLEHASSAPRLLAAFAREPAAIIVIDDDASSGTSVDVARGLRSMAGGELTQILVMTRRMFEDRDAWTALGARRVPKPVSVRALATRLDEMLTAPAR